MNVPLVQKSSGLEVRRILQDQRVHHHALLRGGTRLNAFDGHQRKAQDDAIPANSIGTAGITDIVDQTFVHFTYVNDVSGSTADPCGTSSTGGDILDCENSAVINLNHKIVETGVAVDVAVVAFSWTYAEQKFDYTYRYLSMTRESSTKGV
jgi:hypothetical protein